MKLKEYFAQLKVDLEPMTFPEKIDHIWSYNKELILIVLGVAILVIGLLVTFLTKPDVVFCGFAINAEFSEEGTNYLSSDYGEVIGVSGKQEVQLLTGIFNTKLSSAAQFNEATSAQIVAYCSDQALDYIIADEMGISAFAQSEIYIDLSTFFTEEEFARLQDKILYAELEDGSKIPYAVNISDTKFVQDCNAALVKTDLYIGFINNTKSLDRCHEFWDYLNSWE